MHIFLTENYRPAKLYMPEMKSCDPGSQLTPCVQPRFTQLQCHRPPLLHSTGHKRQLGCSIPHVVVKSIFPNFRLPLQSLPNSYPALLRFCHPSTLPPLLNSLREVKIQRHKLQILSWFTPGIHSRHKNNQFPHLCPIRSEPKLLNAAVRTHGLSKLLPRTE